MIYYIDPVHGNPAGDGLTPETARLTYTDLCVKPGDSVLFKRGSVIRDRLIRVAGDETGYITYGAYGEGEVPVFYGSADVSDPADWAEERPNVWRYTKDLPTEACNFIYTCPDGSTVGATLRWEEDYLTAQGDWHDTRMGMAEQKTVPEEVKVLVYSVGNPGQVYRHIECALWGRRNLSNNVPYTVTEDLGFFGSGVHGMSGGSHHMIIRRCSFCFIGGSVWNRNLRIRFGNAIEFWEQGDDILIEDCCFNEIFDSCITHQGSSQCQPAHNLVMRNNFFANYGMGAYEGRDKMSVNSAFTGNTCVYAGYGFSGYGDTKPRSSEIYPQPMGHHLFMWRIPEASEGGCLDISENTFLDAAGAAMYSIISPEAESQMKMHDNWYYTNNKKLFNHIGGKSYAPHEFEDYLREYGEDGGEYLSAMPDPYEIRRGWCETTGCSDLGLSLLPNCLKENAYFTGTTEKDALGYRPGEEITFRLKLIHGGEAMECASFAYTMRDDYGNREDGKAPGGSAFTYTVKPEKPGYIHLIVKACGEDGSPLPDCDVFEGGACAGFDEITQSGAVPEDFDGFWNRVIRQELDPVPPAEIEKKLFVCGDPGDDVFDVKIACPGPANVSGYLRIPKNAPDKSLPIIVSYMGYSVTSAPIPTKAHAIQLFINPHGLENGRSMKYYKQLERETYAGFGFDETENETPDTVYFKYMILRALQAVRYCRTLPQWDGVNVKTAGGSMGAFQATAAAALDRGVNRLEIHIPWMCDLRGVQGGRLGGWRPAMKPGLDYYDTVSFGARVECDTVISAGLGDYVCPPSGVTALYHALRGKKRMEMLQNKTHPYTAPEYSIHEING